MSFDLLVSPRLGGEPEISAATFRQQQLRLALDVDFDRHAGGKLSLAAA